MRYKKEVQSTCSTDGGCGNTWVDSIALVVVFVICLYFAYGK